MDKIPLYGEAALKAVGILKCDPSKTPPQAWKLAIGVVTKSEASRKKGCPRNAFLGLCEEGYLEGIPQGNYTNSKENKCYALQAVEQLRRHPELANSPAALWNRIEKTAENHQGQMHVVIALWEEGLINREKLGK